MCVLSGSRFVRRDERGVTKLDTRAVPDLVQHSVFYAGFTPRHTLENTGDEPWWPSASS